MKNVSIQGVTVSKNSWIWLSPASYRVLLSGTYPYNANSNRFAPNINIINVYMCPWLYAFKALICHSCRRINHEYLRSNRKFPKFPLLFVHLFPTALHYTHSIFHCTSNAVCHLTNAGEHLTAVCIRMHYILPICISHSDTLTHTHSFKVQKETKTVIENVELLETVLIWRPSCLLYIRAFKCYNI